MTSNPSYTQLYKGGKFHLPHPTAPHKTLCNSTITKPGALVKFNVGQDLMCGRCRKIAALNKERNPS